MPATSGLEQNVWPMAAACDREEVTTLNVPDGKPALSTRAASAKAENGVSSAGRATQTQPAAKAAAIFRTNIANGKFHGVMKPTTPIGSLRTTSSLVLFGETYSKIIINKFNEFIWKYTYLNFTVNSFGFFSVPFKVTYCIYLQLIFLKASKKIYLLST